MKTVQELGQLLTNHNLKQTQKRIEVLGLFHKHSHALSSKMIEGNFKSFDRVTLYRLLNSFEENGLIHKVINDRGDVFYAKCNSCHHATHNDDHVHFHCIECQKIYCLDEVNHSNVQVPSGFSTSYINLAVYGLCKNCN